MKFQSIGICLKPDEPDCEAIVSRLVAWAVKRNIEVAVDRKVSLESEVAVLDLAELCASVDLIISVGGDGTLLSVARALETRDIPILGINLGTLGFLTEVNRNEMEECLDRMLAGDVPIQARMRLEILIYRDGRQIANHLALNDLVINRTALSRMVDLETFADGVKVTTYHADGLIISTPTGSTAYSLSAAGPILLPDLEALVLTPICPHSLTQRPLVLPHHTEVEVRVQLAGADSATLTVDGQAGLSMSDGDRVVARRSPHDVQIVSSPFRNRFEILHTKLHWGGR